MSRRVAAWVVLGGIVCMVLGCAGRALAPKERKGVTVGGGGKKFAYTAAPSAPTALHPKRAAPKAPGVKAGWADDNKQYNYYLQL